MHGWHGLSIDIEHVLPKGNGKYPELTFELRNLSVSCKRCNMGIKREDTSFYIGGQNDVAPFKSANYKFIHPNLDVANDHLEILTMQHNEKLMIKYEVVGASTKGRSAYEYFKLRTLELNSFDEAQDLAEVSPSESFPPELARELDAVLDSIAPTVT
jgi:hypothetical protein